MPNTLGHIAFQGFATRALLPDADPKWVCLGCVLPDVPWIVQRLLHPFFPGELAFDLRLYAVVQGSLFFCLLLCAAASGLAARPWRVFGLLALGAGLHLLIDAAESTWAGGVHFFAPLSWRPLRLGWLWPESPLSVLLTLGGLVYVARVWRRRDSITSVPLRLEPARTALVLALLLAYATLPLALLSGPAAADNDSIATLRDSRTRPGRLVQFNRVVYRQRAGGDVIETATGEELAVRGRTHDRTGRVSLRGRFVDADTLEVLELHAHWPAYRDLGSYVGLALVAATWIASPGSGRGRAHPQVPPPQSCFS